MRRLVHHTTLAAAFAAAACQVAPTAPTARSSAATQPGAAAFSSASAGADLKLHPDGFGKRAYAAWKAQEGEADNSGNANQALYFQKMTTTATEVAGVAVITGLEGEDASARTGLSWEHRTDGWCGAGAPRWDVFIAGASGAPHTVFLGCAAAAHTPGSTAGWIKDSYGAAAIATAIGTAAGGDLPATITGLSIVFDEGTDVPLNPGFVFLDNITVNTKTWTSPADNGN